MPQPAVGERAHPRRGGGYHLPVVPGPLLLLAPSRAAAVELPRRLATVRGAIAGIYGLTLRDLARAIAEHALLGRGLRPWDHGHDALLAARLLDGPHGLPLPADLPRAPIAAALARTLGELRRAGADAGRLADLAARPGLAAEDAARLGGLARLFRGFTDEIEGKFADPATIFRAAAEHVAKVPWLAGAECVVAGDLELDAGEAAFLAALAGRCLVRRLPRARPAGLRASSFGEWGDAHGVRETPWSETVFAPLAPGDPPPALARLREKLFEPPAGEAASDDSVLLVTAPGEAAEAVAIVRRLLGEAARGVPFEDMGVLLPRADPYAPLFTDLLGRLGIPHRLHPSLPLRYGRAARALQLLFRCRGLARTAVLEFLTFAPIPFAEILGEGVVPRTARWDALSRDAGVVARYEGWLLGLRAYADTAREAALREETDERRAAHLARAAEAEVLLRLVEILNAALQSLEGEASWAEWSERLGALLDQWIGPERDRTAVAEVIADLASLAAVAGGRAFWREVEPVLTARFDLERVPLDPVEGGAVHVGVFDALAGLPFRLVAIPGLVEGGYPGVLRPDPFLLDEEREALRTPPPVASKPLRQLSLFDEAPGETLALRLGQDRLLEERRAFHAALSQATERLILSYPRADPRSGRERLPSLFFAAAASTLAGRPLGAAALAAMVVEDDPATLALDDAVDRGERDRARVRRGGAEAVLAIAGGSPFFKWSHLAARERWSKDLTAHDGRLSGLPPEVARRLDPLTSPWPVSASSLATYAKCGFQYLLRHVLRLEPVEEPEERFWLDPLELGLLFHETAERFLRERRDRGALPVESDEATEARLLEIAKERAAVMVAGRPPRHRMLWDMRWRAFEDLLRRWLAREADQAGRATPRHFEVGFGLSRRETTDEPHSKEPLTIDLDGRTLRVSGKIDRIDERPDGSLVLRDYKTGRAPKDQSAVFRGGRELQMPIYVLAARKLFPGKTVSAAFLDFVASPGAPLVHYDSATVAGDEFSRLLADMTAAMADGVFAQQPGLCAWCDFGEETCGPEPLLFTRQSYKVNDRALQRYLRLKDYR